MHTPAGVGTPSGGGDVCPGGTATLVFPVTGHPLPQWNLRRDGTIVASGTATSDQVTHETPVVSAPGAYFLEAWNECNGGLHAFSAVVNVMPVVPPTLTTSLPGGLSLCEGAPLSLSVSATGDAPLTYQWFHDGSSVGSGPTLTVAAVAVADSGAYRVVVSNPASGSCGTAEAECTVTVVSAPVLLSVDQGVDPGGVLVQWSDVQAGAYRLYRSDAAGGIGKTALTPWTTALSFHDATGIPGRGYYYSVASATDAAGTTSCLESAEIEGWRELAAPFASIQYTFPQTYALLSWTPVPGAATYRVFRRQAGEASFAAVSDWIPGTSFRAAGIASETYEFQVVAAVDSAGAHPGGPSNVVSQTMPCQQPGQTCGAAGAPGLLILIDRSSHMLAPTATGTRWTDAVTYAQQEVSAFYSQCPDGSVAVWTFAGVCVEDLTTGFVDQAAAQLVLQNLPGEPSSTLGAPLAAALCHGITSLCVCVSGTGSCTIPTVAGPKEKILLVLSDGINDPDGSTGSFCDGPDATGTDCSNFMPLNSWPRRICNLLTGTCPTVFVLEWDMPFPSRVGDPSALAALAERSGGLARAILDGDPLPAPFFGDCNGNGLPDAFDIQSGASQDCNADGVPDECQEHLDCNSNGVPDVCDLTAGTSLDHNQNGRPDECEGFVLSGPELPLAGVHNEFHVIGGRPLGVVRLFARRAGRAVSTSPPPGSDLGLDRSRSFLVAEMKSLDGNGHAVFQLGIPPELHGEAIQLRVLDDAGAEAAITVAFQ